MDKVTVTKPSSEELQSLGIDNWSPWECEVKVFDWEYDTRERFYVHEGNVTVKTTDGQEISFTKGDLVEFPAGVKCTWDVKEKIRKVYKMG